MRQVVLVQFSTHDDKLIFPDLSEADLDFQLGDVLPVVEEDGAKSWKVAETHRVERLGEDGSIEREWTLLVVPLL